MHPIPTKTPISKTKNINSNNIIQKILIQGYGNKKNRIKLQFFWQMPSILGDQLIYAWELGEGRDKDRETTEKKVEYDEWEYQFLSIIWFGGKIRKERYCLFMFLVELK